jgi:hypothetical protein
MNLHYILIILYTLFTFGVCHIVAENSYNRGRCDALKNCEPEFIKQTENYHEKN